MPHLDATTEAVFIQVAFVTVAILVAWIVLGLLKGSAQVKQKGVQFGGAAAMFVAVFFLLNKYVPAIRDGIISEARASQSQQVITKSDNGSADTLDVYLSPDQQIISMRDLNKLDKNKYYVDERLGLAVLRPTDPSWIVGVLPSFDIISIADAPMMALSLNSVRLARPVGKGSVFAVNSSKVHTIVLNRDSEIEGLRLDFNPFGDETFLRMAVEAQMNSAASIMPQAELNDPSAREKQITLMLAEFKEKNEAERLIKKAFPLTKKVQNGIRHGA